MTLVAVTNVQVAGPNPASLDTEIALAIQFACLQDLNSPLVWKLIYVGSATDKSKDQELDCVEIGPLKRGAMKFLFRADPPDLNQIDPDELWGSTVMLLEASYRGQEFVRIGWYVNNVYVDPALQDDPPDVADVTKMVRYIAADEPRVTRFRIQWEEEEQQHREHTTNAASAAAAAMD